MCDELVVFLGGFNRYTPNGAAGRALRLESYDGGPQGIDRIKRGHTYVPNWSVIVAGNIQPRRLAGIAALEPRPPVIRRRAIWGPVRRWRRSRSISAVNLEG